MKLLLDTSVLVAGLVESHPRHEWCFSWLARLHRGEIEGVVCSHSLLELYAVLTRLPIRPPLSAEQAWRLIEHNLLGKVVVAGLSVEDYWEFLSWLAERQIAGGRVYDALIALSGQRVQVEAIATLNPRHFEGLVAGVRILTPAE
ncbi:Predicted nucleic acid-binding protein, contains PIN domain [Armatimonadetes bacterium GBS]|jgi:predicted nucleic acid-binding protein|nr:MAG: twitching motility protein PilT [Fimbriimonadales bacterium]CUU10960.1 Predicted nucleic acid-binding protein, contains PIN domain [Armatimonadetes bacterium GBS]CUU37237.1 Predicted nucleic acid-binding protein, contains PIN domain [Armatimonadetes bacterium GXS]